MSAFDRLQNYSAREGYKSSLASADNGGKTTLKDVIADLGFDMVTSDGGQTELSSILDVYGNQEVNAIAGSGKTTALSLKVIYDMYTGAIMTEKSLPSGIKVNVVDKTWVCTFLRSGAEDLKASIDTWQRALHVVNRTEQITFSTLDAEFLHSLEAMGVRVTIGESRKLFSLLQKAINMVGVLRSDGTRLENDDYKIIESVIISVRGKLDETKYCHPSCSDYSLTPKIIDDIILQYQNLKRQDAINDFEDLQELLYKFLYVTPNSAVQEFVANRYNNIYVDEFQDTSQLQYALLKYYARNSLWLNKDGKVHDGDPLYHPSDHESKMVVVGDVSQCIYSFKGSDSKILGRLFDEDFRPTISALSCNWRCPSNILNPIIPSIHLNSDSAKQKMYSAKEGGEFHLVAMHNVQQMLATLVEDIRVDIQSGLNVAVLCRTNYEGYLPAFMLEMEGFDFGVSSRAMSADNAIAKRMLGVASLFTERSTPAVKTALEQFVAPYNKAQVASLITTLKNNNLSVWNVPDADLLYSVPEVYNVVKMVKGIFIDANGKRDRHKEIDALKVLYVWLRDRHYTGHSVWAEQARTLCNLYVIQIERGNYNSVNDFLDDIDIYSDSLSGKIGKTKAQVLVSTVHEFKGKEADSVIIWNDCTDIFPYAKCNLDNDSELEEERRVHYIACTRAKKKERIYTINGKFGMFVKEMDATPESSSYTPKAKVLPSDVSGTKDESAVKLTDVVSEES